MHTPRLPRARRSRSTSLVAILLLTVSLATFLAYEAWDAARSHRATAEGAIRDYARFAAWEFSVNSKEVLYSTLLWVFSPIAALEVGAPGEPLPSPSVLSSEKFAELLCTGDSVRYHFRLDVRDGGLVMSGDTPSAAMRAWIADTVPRHARAEYRSDYHYATLNGFADGRPRTIIYQLKRDNFGRPAVAYGFELCVGEFAAGGFRKVMKSYAILPPSLTGGAPNDTLSNDSLFSVRVSDGAGREVFRSKVQYPATYTGEYKLEAFGGLTTVVAMRPSAANSLLIGGLPSSRVPLVLGVLVLTIGLAAMGVLQLRREGELARLRSDFIASVSHELRTPLAQVRMFAETLLLGRVRNEEERTRSLQIVDQEARRLTHLVENILQFSRAERRAIRLAPEAAELAGQVREAAECFTPVARARRASIEMRLEDDVVAMVDPGAMRQIVLNLLDNAVKYGPVGQTVTIGLERTGDSARLWVDDQGPGIAPADRERVWKAFFRLDGAVSSAVAGSGIGLAVVAELVTLHDGRAWIEDASGGGARFIVELHALAADGATSRRVIADGQAMAAELPESAAT